MELTCTIEGLSNMRAQFEEFSDKVQRAVMRKALTQTGNIVKKAARAKVPVLTGALKKSITLKVSVKEEAQSYVTIFATKPHAHLIEFGHAIKGTKGGPSFGFVAAHPFMRPAVDENHAAILEGFVGFINEQIQKQAAKAKVT